MKKLIFVIVSVVLLLVSCTTTKLINAEKLENDVFVINRIVLKSNTIEPTDEELVQIFKSLPYVEICDAIEEKTSIVVDPYYIENDYFDLNIEYNMVFDAETDEKIDELKEWEVNIPVDPEETQFCELICSMDPPDGYLSVEAFMHTTQIIPAESEDKEDKIVNLQKRTYLTFEKWTFKNIFVDPRSCAQIRFNKNIKPTFIENELFDVYKKLNTSEDGYINLNIKTPVEIRCNIDDPGNLFFSPAQIYNARFVGTFDPGKKYYLKYKLKRRSPDSTNWIVIFVLKEEKPKLTK
ncbi:MAG: hypothetical protein IK102_10825 [Treponema sp.]|nr:hypothetical protein [Treponema sp.]